MNTTDLSWPRNNRIAVAVTVMYEAWSDGSAPTYSVQTTHLKPGAVDHAGAAWSTYGGRVGVWSILRTFERLGVPATFFVNARCAELYPDSIVEIARAGHDIAGHGYTQDGLLSYMTPEDQHATIRKCVDLLGAKSGKCPTGWLSPVLAFTPQTIEFLAAEKLQWQADVTYTDLPHRVETKHGPIACVPNSDFTDNRVLRTNPEDLYDVYTGTFDYLYQHEPMSLLVLTLHCHFGGRPMVTQAFERVMRYIARFPGVWLARHHELGRWALEQEAADRTYRSRFFAGA
jgi:peptidoglycan/xylan/chitin deacetylase (PgdA/CDA1 family)